MSKNKKINVQGVEIVLYEDNSNDFISLTDIARHKNPEHTDDLIKNWMRNRNTIELLGFWETIYNPDFKPVEFDGFRKQAGLNSFVMTPKRWIESRTLKDYNAQTYWLSINIKSFFKQTKLPSWFNIALGYGANGMFAASSNIVKDDNGNIIFNRNDIARYRQFYLAPDIDFTKIKTHSKFFKIVFFALNAFKFPTPALALSQGCLQWKWIVF